MWFIMEQGQPCLAADQFWKLTVEIKIDWQRAGLSLFFAMLAEI